jgi:lipoyl(octanoyl) transferase
MEVRNVIQYMDAGRVGYREGWDMQRAIFDRLVAREQGAAQVLILCEHPHVYTIGKSGEEGNLLVNSEFLARIGATCERIDRGGDITYHGPGQLVGYPIIDLERSGIGLKEYIHRLEQAIIDTLADFAIAAGRSEGAAGVWLEEGGLRKIAAIGVRSSRWVTMHGFALNVNTDLTYFGHINPCGFTDRGVTSMERELGRAVAMDEVKAAFRRHFERVFGVEVRG